MFCQQNKFEKLNIIRRLCVDQDRKNQLVSLFQKLLIIGSDIIKVYIHICLKKML